MPMKITTKIMLFINLMVAFILGILVFLSYFKYLNLVEEFTSSQAAAFSADLKQTALKAETLGLKLENLEQFKDVLERIADKEDRIDAILIFNSRGKIISQFDRNQTGLTYEKDIVTSSIMKSKAGNTWTLFAEKNVGFGRYLFTDMIGTKIFSVFLYDKDAFESENRIIKRDLLALCLFVVGPSVFILALMIFFIFRPIQSAYNQIREETTSYFVNGINGSPSQRSEYGESMIEVRDLLQGRESPSEDEVR